MIEFRYLPAFFAVAETKSFTEAGKRLHIATSAVSRQIQLLEEACDLQLFFRSPREAILTEGGKKLFEEMQLFQSEANKILDRAAVPTFRIGILQGVLEHWFMSIVTKDDFFRRVNVELRVGSPLDLIAWMNAGDIDVTFFSSVYATHVPTSLQAHPLFREDIVLISSQKIALDDLEDHPWICFSLNSWIVKYVGKQPLRWLVVNHMKSVVECVRAGMGIAMVPSYILADRSGLHVQDVKKFAREQISLLTRRFDREPTLHTEFKSLVKRWVAAQKH